MQSVAAVNDALARDFEARGEATHVIGAFEHGDRVSRLRESEGGAEAGGAGTEHDDVSARRAHSATATDTRSGYPYV